MEFLGQVAIVTGAANGIGLATVKELSSKGADVALVDLNEKALEAAKEELLKNGHQVLTYVCDVGDYDRVKEVTEDVLAKLGKIDILVNNAGFYNDDYALFKDSKISSWEKKLRINLYGTMYFTKCVVDSMIENHYGRIVNIGSVAGVYGNAKMVDYSMSKGAVISFTYALSKELAEHGITVNCVSPGNISNSINALGVPELSYLDRAGSSEECAAVIVFLASKKASYVIGQNYLVDGGRRKI